VPVDLLRHLIGPTPYSSWVLGLAIVLSTILVCWYVGVVLLTLPGRRTPVVPLVVATRDRMTRRRFARAVHDIGGRYRAGELGAAEAGAAISGEVRRFLHRATGAPAEYMQLDDIEDSGMTSAAVVLSKLTDVQFNSASQFDVGVVGDDAEELIRSWT
jgi:hypothetical protein